ncbi:MAG: ribosomal L7Ae/L30e/S12e/Gadd45 family protein [Candidatus Nanohaloarchaea archaeon]|nr:ribosomal L7Ae/L30e/S12e/Gadd45 family protein [Candidatus Nanohaloarchaea archaeon]
MGIEDDVQAAAETGSVVIGTEETIKNIDGLDRVVVASNAPADVVEAVAAAADGTETAVVQAAVDNHELGALCMEPFAASVVGIE